MHICDIKTLSWKLVEVIRKDDARGGSTSNFHIVIMAERERDMRERFLNTKLHDEMGGIIRGWRGGEGESERE